MQYKQKVFNVYLVQWLIQLHNLLHFFMQLEVHFTDSLVNQLSYKFLLKQSLREQDKWLYSSPDMNQNSQDIYLISFARVKEIPQNICNKDSRVKKFQRSQHKEISMYRNISVMITLYICTSTLPRIKGFNKRRMILIAIENLTSNFE